MKKNLSKENTSIKYTTKKIDYVDFFTNYFFFRLALSAASRSILIAVLFAVLCDRDVLFFVFVASLFAMTVLYTMNMISSISPIIKIHGGHL